MKRETIFLVHSAVINQITNKIERNMLHFITIAKKNNGIFTLFLSKC